MIYVLSRYIDIDIKDLIESFFSYIELEQIIFTLSTAYKTTINNFDNTNIFDILKMYSYYMENKINQAISLKDNEIKKY